jgi:hypothetical protein
VHDPELIPAYPPVLRLAVPGNLFGLAPGAVGLGDDERLTVAGTIEVIPAGAALSGRGARHRGDRGEPARVRLAVPGTLFALPRVPLVCVTTNA